MRCGCAIFAGRAVSTRSTRTARSTILHSECCTCAIGQRDSENIVTAISGGSGGLRHGLDAHTVFSGLTILTGASIGSGITIGSVFSVFNGCCCCAVFVRDGDCRAVVVLRHICRR